MLATLFQNIRRTARHVFMGPVMERHHFGRDVQDRLHQAITAGEATHAANVRLIIEAAMPLRKIWRGMSTRQRAVDLFGTFRVWDTEDNNGVLLYLNLADRKLELVCDRAAARAITDPEWQVICNAMLTHLRAGAFEQGLAEGLAAIHHELAEAFPKQTDTPDRSDDDAPVVI